MSDPLTDGGRPQDGDKFFRFTWERMVRDTKMDPSTKLAALILATYADMDGTRVRPGLKRLSAVTGKSQRTMQRAMVDLRDMGLLDRVSKGSNFGVEGMVDVYALVLPSANQVTPMSHGQVTPMSPGDTHGTNQVTPMTQPRDTHVHLPSHDQDHHHAKGGGVDPLENFGLGEKERDAFMQSLRDQGSTNPPGLLRTLSHDAIAARLATHREAHGNSWGRYKRVGDWWDEQR